MKTEIELITPQKALDYLKNNTKNRTLRKNTVLYYAEQMKEGKWKLTGQGISFSSDMILIDGQHRLAAIVKSNTEQYMNVTYGLDYNEVYPVYDTGKNRSSADVLSINKVKYSAIIASAIKNKEFLDLGKLGIDGSRYKVKLTNEKILEKYKLNSEVYDLCAKHAMRCHGKMKLINPALIAAISSHLIITKKNDKSKVFLFFNALHMIDEYESNAIALLRNIIINDLANKLNKMTQKTKLKYIIKVWNAYISNDDYKKLRLLDKDNFINFI